MPRDINGIYSLASGNPVQAGTTIEDSWANSTMDDLAAAMTDSLSRSGQGGMLAPFAFVDGTVNSPGMAWSNENGTGFYRAGAFDMRLAQQGFGDAFRWLNRVSYTRNADNSAWAAIVYEGGVGSTPSGTADLDTLVWNVATSKWTIQVKNAGGVLPVGSASNVNLKWNDTLLAWEAVQAPVVQSLIDAGTVTDQSTRWDNTTSRWVPNSTITMTAAGLVTAVGFAGPLTGNVTGNVTGNLIGNADSATLAANSSQLGGIAAANYPTITPNTYNFTVIGSLPGSPDPNTIYFVTT